MGYLRKEPDGSLLYNVVNQLDPDAEGLLALCNQINIVYNPVFMQHLPLHFFYNKQHPSIVLLFLQKRRLIK